MGPVYDSSRIMDDPHYREREDILEIQDPELGPTTMLGVVPKFSETPGAVTHAGPRLGQHNSQVYKDWLGLGPERLGGVGSQRGHLAPTLYGCSTQ